jgi:hypothetical protein
MMANFDQIRKEAKARGAKRLVVAPVTDATDLSALSAAMAEGLVFPILAGDGKAAESWVGRERLPAAHLEVIDEPDGGKALALAIDMVRKGAAEILMRGGLAPDRSSRPCWTKRRAC